MGCVAQVQLTTWQTLVAFGERLKILVSVGDVEGDSGAPWALVSFLAGKLGPCLTQTERNRPASQVRFSARALCAGCRARLKLATTTRWRATLRTSS